MSHECTEACPMHNVFIPTSIVASADKVPASIMLPDEMIPDEIAQLDPPLPVLTVSLIGVHHPHDLLGPAEHEHGITIGLVHDQLEEFLIAIIAAAEHRTPGYIGTIVARAFQILHGEYHDECESFRSRLLAAIDGYAASRGIDITDMGLEAYGE